MEKFMPDVMCAKGVQDMQPVILKFWALPRSIMDNSMAVQLGIEMALKTNQNVLILQLDYAKAFDTVAWDFIHAIMSKMGFGSKMSSIVFLLGQHASFRIIINGRLSAPVQTQRSMKQGCPLSPLLFAVSTHPLFSFLEQ
ncbi:hypothetical protein L7F22_029360 [Adiantum nelumboides]|nr:hypothetical protein [Adiantum nelumboides]